MLEAHLRGQRGPAPFESAGAGLGRGRRRRTAIVPPWSSGTGGFARTRRSASSTGSVR